MKRTIVFVLLFLCAFSTAVFAQTADYAFSAIIKEAQDYVNGCGPDGVPQWAISSLNWISGNYGACNQHDIDYGTLGMSRLEADNRLFHALRVDSWTAVPAVAGAFWAAIRRHGDNAYNTAQRQSAQEFRRIHHGNDWSSWSMQWHPSYGHVPMSFPQCVQSCPNLSRR